jgi:hypothetical protein
MISSVAVASFLIPFAIMRTDCMNPSPYEQFNRWFHYQMRAISFVFPVFFCTGPLCIMMRPASVRFPEKTVPMVCHIHATGHYKRNIDAGVNAPALHANRYNPMVNRAYPRPCISGLCFLAARMAIMAPAVIMSRGSIHSPIPVASSRVSVCSVRHEKNAIR